MKIIKTKEVDYHHTNPDYECIMVVWDKNDHHFQLRYRGDHLADWIPKYDEALMIVKALLESDKDNTFRRDLWNMICGLRGRHD